MDARRRIIKILRAVLYVFACMVAVILIYMLVRVAYNTALNTMSVNMITEDAFARRAQSVLLPTSTDEVILGRLFSQNALATDNVMNSDAYDEYVVLDYYERVDIDTTIVWAWEETASIRLTEVMRFNRRTARPGRKRQYSRTICSAVAYGYIRCNACERGRRQLAD